MIAVIRATEAEQVLARAKCCYWLERVWVAKETDHYLHLSTGMDDISKHHSAADAFAVVAVTIPTKQPMLTMQKKITLMMAEMQMQKLTSLPLLTNPVATVVRNCYFPTQNHARMVAAVES